MLIRFRYPVSLPQDIAFALGIDMNNSLRFEALLDQLLCHSTRPTRLAKFMPREEAEYAFQCALRKDRFAQNSLFSFYFNEGWLEFELQFDDQSRLRRVYLHHKLIPAHRGHELILPIDDHSLIQASQETPDTLYIA
jgi:hypothetical protein